MKTAFDRLISKQEIQRRKEFMSMWKSVNRNFQN